MNYKMTGLIVISIAALAIGLFINQHPENPVSEQVAADSPKQVVLSETTDAPSANTGPSNTAQKPDSLLELGQALQEKFGQVLNHPKIQVRALEKIIEELKRIYGQQWP